MTRLNDDSVIAFKCMEDFCMLVLDVITTEARMLDVPSWPLTLKLSEERKVIIV